MSIERAPGSKSYLSAYPSIGSKILRRWHDIPWRLSKAREALFPTEFALNYRLVRPYTMSSYSRLRGLHEAVNEVIRKNIPGDLVECGTARGGSAALMGLTLTAASSTRRLWVFDTFEGLPPPTLSDPDYEIAQQYTGECRGEFDEVEELFRRLGILEQSTLVKGLFQNSLPVAGIKTISVLHIDGDWYESVKTCLDQLYDQVAPGGVIQIDDYGHWAGARKAVHEFLARRGINSRLRYIDYTGRQLFKSG